MEKHTEYMERRYMCYITFICGEVAKMKSQFSQREVEVWYLYIYLLLVYKTSFNS